MPRLWQTTLLYTFILGLANAQVRNVKVQRHSQQQIGDSEDDNAGIPSSLSGAFYDDNHRELGFFVNRGRERRSRGVYDERTWSNGKGRSGMGSKGKMGGSRSRGSIGAVDDQVGQERARLPIINRDRDPLQEGGWTRKRVDMIRSVPIDSPTATPPPTTPPPTSTSSAPSSTSAPILNETSSPTTAVNETNTTSPGATTAPSETNGTMVDSGGSPGGGDTGGNVTDTIPPTMFIFENTTADETIPPTNGTTVAADELVRSGSVRFDYQVAKDVICTGGAQNFTFVVDIKVNFLDDRFQACTGGDFDDLSTFLKTTLDMAFPTVVPEWPGEVLFNTFDFDVDQFSLHINPFAGNNGRHLLRKEPVADTGYISTVQNHAEWRRLLEGGCPVRPTICQDTTDVCLYGCGVASVKDCGDLNSWAKLSPALSIALSSLSWPCLGGDNPPIVELILLPTV